jgi:hypothetical protein
MEGLSVGITALGAAKTCHCVAAAALLRGFAIVVKAALKAATQRLATRFLGVLRITANRAAASSARNPGA